MSISTNCDFNSLRPSEAIILTNAGKVLIRPIGTNVSEIVIGIEAFSFNKMYLKMSFAKWRPFCPGLNVLTHWGLVTQFGDIDLGQHKLR